jgi:hypothetical protein
MLTYCRYAYSHDNAAFGTQGSEGEDGETVGSGCSQSEPDGSSDAEESDTEMEVFRGVPVRRGTG